MSFDVNFNKPMIQEAKSMQNDGGAGNLGYFEQDGKKDENKKNSSIFDEQGTDTFNKSDGSEELEPDFSFAKLIAEVIMFFKTFFSKLFK